MEKRQIDWLKYELLGLPKRREEKIGTVKAMAAKIGAIPRKEPALTGLRIKFNEEGISKILKATGVEIAEIRIASSVGVGQKIENITLNINRKTLTLEKAFFDAEPE